MKSHLVKVEGAGNDFLLGTGSWAERLSEDSELISHLCDRHRGVGADGVLAVFAEDHDAIRLVHRNADGSPSAFCANGTRCAARAAVDLLGLPHKMLIFTGWAEIPALVRTDAVSLELPSPEPPVELELETEHGRWHGRQMTLGVPHLVLPIDDLDGLVIEIVAPPLRRHPALGPHGANIHFVERSRDGLRLRSYERGVEAETLCCGSGVVAAALLGLADRTADAVMVEARSGDRLKVEALGEPPRAPSRLTGPARLIAAIDVLSA